jgi:hypothetical protein
MTMRETLSETLCSCINHEATNSSVLDCCVLLLGESFLMLQRIMLYSAGSPKFGLLALEDECNTILQNIKNYLPSESVTQQHCSEKI